ncbi:MAG: SprT family zinc-dependent metalloprotease [Sphaerochaeta sp.]
MKTIGKVEGIAYTLFRKRNCKNITLRVLADGSVRVSAPHTISLASIERVIARNHVKLGQTIERQKKENEPFVHTWKDGDSFLFCGNMCPLVIVIADRDTIDFVDNRFYLTYTGKHPTEKEVCVQIKEIFRTTAKNRIAKEILFWAEKLNLTPPPFSIRDAKRRWGSCSANGTLSFSLRSASLDEGDLSYLVLHEMAHLVYFDHGKDFHAFLDIHLKDWKIHQKHMFSLQRITALSI